MGQPSATYNTCDRKRAATRIFPSSPFPSRETQKAAECTREGPRPGVPTGRWRLPAAAFSPAAAGAPAGPRLGARLPRIPHISTSLVNTMNPAAPQTRTADLRWQFVYNFPFPPRLGELGKKRGKKEGRCPLPKIIFKGTEISCSTKAKPAARKGNHLYFGSLPPFSPPLCTPPPPPRG